MAAIEALASASAKLQKITRSSDKGSDGQIRDIVAHCRHLLSANALDSVYRDESTLDHFDPGRDSIIYLLLLRLQIQALQGEARGTLPYDLLPSGRLWTRSVRYLEIFDAIQVRYTGQEFRQVIEYVGQASEAASKAWLYLLSYRSLTNTDYLRYFLYGGMVYMALKEWRKALHLLSVVISMPTMGSVSMVMVEAYKKWILVGLLANGKLSLPPNVTSSSVVKLYQSLAKPYIRLAETFERGDMKKLVTEVENAREIWSMDRNMGLVSQVVNTFSGHALVGLRKTFAALTVTEILEQAPYLPADTMAAETLIASLIMSGAMNAALVHSSSQTSDTMLRLSGILEKKSQLMTALMGSLEEINHALGLSDEFVDSSKGQTWMTSSDTNQGLVEDYGLDMDEDIMGG
ncbi:uncharacterized protein N7477_004795 [Penicillium maclennaniae]|uniref:uncharacterized protein n=1 Tax=Penicillium maclennaniae TaxID=1343394 RepID=UPI00253FDF33|nr:uncharacterized protein N7477_004795 [Penicillium maclennaniae]KAJ5674861.1 hypothetical protein N7477_004795 [Penicillium maclennaniae]